MKQSESNIRAFVKQDRVLPHLEKLDRRGKAKFTIPWKYKYLDLIFKFALCDNAKIALTNDHELDGKLTDREKEIGAKWERDNNIVGQPGKKSPQAKDIARKHTVKFQLIVAGAVFEERGESWPDD